MKRINIRYGVITFLGLCSFLIFTEGFVAGTLVKTPVGYTAIEQLNIGESVICFDDDNNCVEQSVDDIWWVFYRAVVDFDVIIPKICFFKK